MVVLHSFLKLKGSKVVQVEFTSLKWNFLLHTWVHTYLLNIIVSVGCIEHFWSIIDISLFCNTCVDANMSLSLRIDLERQLELEIISNSLKRTNQISCQEKHVGNWWRDCFDLQIWESLCARRLSCKNSSGHRWVLWILGHLQTFCVYSSSKIYTSADILAVSEDFSCSSLVATVVIGEVFIVACCFA